MSTFDDEGHYVTQDGEVVGEPAPSACDAAAIADWLNANQELVMP